MIPVFHLIKIIIEFADLKSSLTNSRTTTAALPFLHKDLEGTNRKYAWNYRAITGMLNYLTGSTIPDISMVVHQISRFSNDPKLSHEKSIIRVCRYLLGTLENGIVFKPDNSKGLELYVDADFAGN